MKPGASAILMIIAIIGITGFQLYWLKNNYEREQTNLNLTVRAGFEQTITDLQRSKLKLEIFTMHVDTIPPTAARFSERIRHSPSRAKKIGVINLLQSKMRDSMITRDGTGEIVITMRSDSVRFPSDSSIRRTIRRFPPQTARTVRDHMFVDSALPPPQEIQVIRESSSGSMVRKEKNPGTRSRVLINDNTSGSEMIRDVVRPRGVPGEPNSVFRWMYNIDSVAQKDSVTVKEVSIAFQDRMQKEGIDLPVTVKRLDSTDTPSSSAITIGFATPIVFDYTIDNTIGYLLNKLKLPILFSILLVGITVASFVMLYRNMLKQQRLAASKNEFISNITHELKTPIATVGVAIEALKSFNAIHDPKRTAEYLDISQHELQRLNLLVDKVLKLSMFEKKEIDLKYERFNLEEIVTEVVESMRLQIEKFNAKVTVNTIGDCAIEADRLHLLSVLFNLLDNALKYGKGDSTIHFQLEEKDHNILLSVRDNGIGIPAGYKDKVFEKFFRVPHGDTHNAKGYGLGLSYTAHVVKKHEGKIWVESIEGEGSTFMIELPKKKP